MSKKGVSKRITALFAVMTVVFAVFVTGCGNAAETDGDIPKISGLEYESTLPLEYADRFAVYKYKGGYSYIRITDSDDIFVVPEGGETPENLDPGVVVVKQPLDRIYLAATSAMSLFEALDAYDSISFVSTKHWYIESAIAALEEGRFVYAGKYNAPDYELLISRECQLAVESTMILHNPEVREKMQELGIKTIVERSSYEKHPLGRTEWIKFYGVLLGLEDEAEAAFDEQVEKINALDGIENTGKTVAFFYVNSNGNAITYKTGDYVPEMIRIAGGEYIFTDLGLDDESKLSTVNMSMEEFFATAKDADIVIYNCSIVSQLKSLDDFLDLSPVMKGFKAVKEGNVWCTSRSMFQQTDKMGSIIQEISAILSGKTDGGDLEYIYRLK